MTCNHLKGLTDIDGRQVKEGDVLVFPGVNSEPYILSWDPEEYGYSVYSNKDPEQRFVVFRPTIVRMMKVIDETGAKPATPETSQSLRS